MSGLAPIGPGAAAGPTYGLTGGQQAGSAANAYGGIGGLSSFNMFSPQQFQQLTSNQVMNPYAGVFQTAAGGAGEMGAQGARNIFGGGSS